MCVCVCVCTCLSVFIKTNCWLGTTYNTGLLEHYGNMERKQKIKTKKEKEERKTKGLKWTLHSPTVQINGHTISCTQNNKWQTAMLGKVLKHGKHTAKFRIDSCVSRWIFIGLVQEHWTGYTALDYVGHTSQTWGFCAQPSFGKCHNNKNSKFGREFKSGDTVSITADMNMFTMSVSVSGTQYGINHYGLSKNLRFAVTLYQPGDRVTYMSNCTHTHTHTY